MKKILFFASALAGLFLAASCQRESLEPEVSCNVVSYTIQVPGAIGTKAIGTDVAAVTELIYEVYRIDEQGTETKLYQKSQTRDAANGETNWTVELELVNNQDFRVLFWAQVPGNGVYTTTSLKNVTLATDLNANAEKYAAFAGQDEITSGENLTGRTVTLVRPVAQLNIATTAESLKLGEDENGANAQTTVSFKTTAVTVEGLSAVYNVADQSVSATTTTFVYGATLPYDNDDATTDNLSEATIKVNNVDYQYVSMNYVGFAQPSGNNVKVTYTIETNEVGIITNTISNVPVKANYRTNIIGNLITSMSDYTITLDAEWKDPDGGNMEVVIDGLVKNVKGDYEISNTAGLAYAINNLMVDNQGAANAATFYIYPGTYDLSEYEIKQINVTSGTLKVYKSIPVVTRSTNDEVIIIGLEKALISEVADGATVLFSGITIQDFEGTGAALVADNKGKVVLSDCEINEDGAPDEDTPLVSGNKPENVVGDDSDSYLVYTAEQLAAAFADNEVESIGLGADIAVENTLVFPADRKATLDLRGWNLTIADPDKVANTYAINNLGDLTIKDSYGIGAVTARGIYNGYDAEGNHSANAKITIVSGTFNAMGTNGGAAVYNYGVADINGGKFVSNGGYGLNNQGTGEMTIDNADVRGGVYNVGTLTVDESKVYQHLSGKHCIYNWEGSVTINGGEFDSESGNELILAGGENASVTINDGTFHKTAKSWLYGAATGKNITFTITGGTHYGYVNEPEMTVDTFRPYGDPIVVTGGSYNFDVTKWCAKDYKAVKNAETAMWGVVPKVYVAKIGEDGYESLQEAIDEVNEGETILLCDDVTIATPAYGQNALNHARAISFTLDLNGKTLEANTGNSVFRYNITQAGATDDVTVTLKNGTITAGDNTWCVVMAAGLSDDIKAVFNLENLTINASKPGDLAVKAWDYALINAKNVTVNATKGAGGFYALGGEIVLDNCTVNQKGLWTAPYTSMAVAVSNGGKATVNSGTYTAVPTAASEGNNQGSSHGSWAAGVMNSGGELIINGGTFANGNFGDDALATAARGLIFGDTASMIVINDGTFNALKSIIDYQNNLGVQPNPNIIINGGDFSADPSVVASYGGVVIKEGYAPTQGANGRWTLVKAQPNNEIWYTGDMELVPTNETALNATIVSSVWDSTTGKGVITFDAPLTAIGNEAFKRITNNTPSNWMTSISLPNSLETIGDYAFYQCFSLTSITIPDSVTSIGQYAFGSCRAATTVTIGSGVTSIASGAFYDSEKLIINKITCKSTIPPTIADRWVFHNIADNHTVIVPAGSVDAYKAAKFWSELNIVGE